MRMPEALRRAATAAVCTMVLLGSATYATAAPVVLELFTSQGCSSCPPADALLGDFVNRDGVIALSLPVDYWNYLGWEDTLAKHAHTERQRAYALARGDAEVYTPQMVVGGYLHAVGSDRAAIEAAILEAQSQPQVSVAIATYGSSVQIEVAAATAGGPTWGTVWVVLYDSQETVAIARGENAGRTVTYRNVVIDMHRLTMWRGEALRVELPVAEMREAQADGCVILIQEERNGIPGPIVGAALYAAPIAANTPLRAAPL